MRRRIVHANLILPFEVCPDGWLLTENGVIADYGTGECPWPAEETTDAAGAYLAPGFVDLHVHGGAGADFRDGDEASFLTALQAHLAGGTTTILPTLSSQSHGDMLKSIDVFNRLKDRNVEEMAIPHLAGLHLEGPYFSMEQKGAQNEELIRNPDFNEVEEVLERTPWIKRWAIACELPGANQLATLLKKRGITACIGHSNATTQQVREAFAHGFSCVTHLYSGCSVVHRNGPFREGGIVEAAFLMDDLDVEMIGDGIHLPPDFLKLIYKIKGPDRIALITDCIRAGACQVPDGTVAYDDREKTRPIYIESGVAIMPDRKNFAGSIATSSHLVRTVVTRANVDLAGAVRMAALTPARMLGMDDRIGSIARGKDADLLLLDNRLEIRKIWLKGAAVCT